jgi:hypothetical protein
MARGSTATYQQQGTTVEEQQRQQEAEAAQVTPEQIAARQAQAQQQANAYGNGSITLGTYAGQDPSLLGQSQMRRDQTGAERTADQRANFFYGGTATGAADAQGTMRGNMAPYTGAFGDLGATYGTTGQSMAGRSAPIYQPGLADARAGGDFSRMASQQLYANAMQGPGPSQAQAQLDASTGQAMRQQLALAGSGRGAGGGAAAFRQAGMNQAQIQGSANAQAAAIRAQEENAWRGQQAGMIAQAGGLAQSQQQQDLAAAGYYTGANQQQTQLNDAAGQGYGQLALGATTAGAQTQMGIEQGAHNINTSAMSGNMGYEGLLNQKYGIDKGIGVQNAQMAAQQEAAWASAIGTGVATTLPLALALSDVRAKEDVGRVSGGMRDMLANVAPSQWFQGSSGMESGIPGMVPQGYEQQQAAAAQAQQAAMMGQAGQLGGQMGRAFALSDERAKTDASRDMPAQFAAELAGLRPNVGKKQPTPEERAFADPGDVDMDRLMARLQRTLPDRSGGAQALQAVEQTEPWSYRYKDPARHGEGTHYGPMAQELAQTPVGRSAVMRQPDGRLAVDTGRLSLINTAALAAKQQEDDRENSAVRRELASLRAAVGRGR